VRSYIALQQHSFYLRNKPSQEKFVHRSIHSGKSAIANCLTRCFQTSTGPEPGDFLDAPVGKRPGPEDGEAACFQLRGRCVPKEMQGVPDARERVPPRDRGGQGLLAEFFSVAIDHDGEMGVPRSWVPEQVLEVYLARRRGEQVR